MMFWVFALFCLVCARPGAGRRVLTLLAVCAVMLYVVGAQVEAALHSSPGRLEPDAGRQDRPNSAVRHRN